MYGFEKVIYCLPCLIVSHLEPHLLSRRFSLTPKTRIRESELTLVPDYTWTRSVFRITDQCNKLTWSRILVHDSIYSAFENSGSVFMVLDQHVVKVT